MRSISAIGLGTGTVTTTPIPVAPHNVDLTPDGRFLLAVGDLLIGWMLLRQAAIALTKLDGSAKGGFVLAVQERTGIPVKLLGQGEGIGDMTGFTPHAFVEQLVE